MKCFLFFDVGIEKKILTGEGSMWDIKKKKKHNTFEYINNNYIIQKRPINMKKSNTY